MSGIKHQNQSRKSLPSTNLSYSEDFVTVTYGGHFLLLDTFRGVLWRFSGGVKLGDIFIGPYHRVWNGRALKRNRCGRVGDILTF